MRSVMPTRRLFAQRRAERAQHRERSARSRFEPYMDRTARLGGANGRRSGRSIRLRAKSENCQ